MMFKRMIFLKIKKIFLPSKNKKCLKRKYKINNPVKKRIIKNPLSLKFLQKWIIIKLKMYKEMEIASTELLPYNYMEMKTDILK